MTNNQRRQSGCCFGAGRQPQPRNAAVRYETGALPLAFPYVPVQTWSSAYSYSESLCRGTLFPDLDLPFECGGCAS